MVANKNRFIGMELTIQYWSQVTNPNQDLIPVFFFHPTIEFLSWIRQKGPYQIPIYIEGTNGLYDGRHLVTLDDVTRLGSCAPDYSHGKPLLALFLPHTSFTIYPPCPGTFRLLV